MKQAARKKANNVVPLKTKKSRLTAPKAYHYTGQAPELLELRAAAAQHGLSSRKLADGSGNSASCTGNWFSGKTRRPLSPTFGAALLQIPNAIGWDYRNRKIIYRS